jgi:hypothetical protein
MTWSEKFAKTKFIGLFEMNILDLWIISIQSHTQNWGEIFYFYFPTNILNSLHFSCTQTVPKPICPHFIHLFLKLRNWNTVQNVYIPSKYSIVLAVAIDGCDGHEALLPRMFFQGWLDWLVKIGRQCNVGHCSRTCCVMCLFMHLVRFLSRSKTDLCPEMCSD